MIRDSEYDNNSQSSIQVFAVRSLACQGNAAANEPRGADYLGVVSTPVRPFHGSPESRRRGDTGRSHEINIRRYLSDDALRSAGSTLVWWLARDGASIDDAVPRLTPFAQVSAVAQGREDPESYAPDSPRGERPVCGPSHDRPADAGR